MTDDASGEWSFQCLKCTASSEWDTEVEALDAAGTHNDNTGHFDFEIRDPDGLLAYPDQAAK